MKKYYWNNGFYDPDIDYGFDIVGYEITEAEWDELLEGQSRGLQIATDDNGRPCLKEYDLTLDVLQDMIKAYDKSPEVNSFTLNGTTGWLDKETRLGLAYSLDMAEKKGGETFRLWLDSIPFDLTISEMRNILEQLEEYAKETFDRTQVHLAIVEELDDLAGYDYKAGYPERLEFTL